MSDESSAAISDARNDWVTEHREMYLRSGGTEGHIEDLTPVGGRTFGTHCLIKYTGRKSGKVFITPLCYGEIGGEVVIVASKGGADSHPEWYLQPPRRQRPSTSRSPPRPSAAPGASPKAPSARRSGTSWSTASRSMRSTRNRPRAISRWC